MDVSTHSCLSCRPEPFAKGLHRSRLSTNHRGLHSCSRELRSGTSAECPQAIVFDNAKCAVTKADWYDPELNPKIVDFCKHYGCAFIPTRPRTPRHKGKVERGVDYVQENALRGREFESLSPAERTSCITGKRPSPTHASTAPPRSRSERSLNQSSDRRSARCRWIDSRSTTKAKRKVSRDGHIAVKRSFYSVPPEYLGCDVWVRYDSRLLRIFNSAHAADRHTLDR